MPEKVRGIEIAFPVAVELTRDDQIELQDVVRKICKRYEEQNPGRVMWLFGYGDKVIYMPIVEGDERPMEFDSTILAIECSEREKY